MGQWKDRPVQGADRIEQEAGIEEQEADRTEREAGIEEREADRTEREAGIEEREADRTERAADAMEERTTASGQIGGAMLLLEEYAKPFITEDETKMAIAMPRIAQVMNLLFPLIVHDYTLPAFADRQAELSQWTGLLAQILETLEGRDTFAKLDVIYAVLLPNLTEHITILRERGL